MLNEMAPSIEFDLEKPGIFVSYRPFDREWKKLSELNALDEIGRSNVLALKSSNIEYFIPKAFATLFLAVLIALVSITLTSWPPTKLVQLSPDTSPSSAGKRVP